MSLEREDIRDALTSKGFVEDKKNGRTDHDFYTLECDGLIRPISTKLSRGTAYRTYTDRLLPKVYKQMKITKPQLTQFVDCHLTASGYVKLLRDQGLVA